VPGAVSGYQCRGCRRHLPRPEYRRVGLGSVCSQECLATAIRPARRDRTPAPVAARSDSDIPLATRVRVRERDRHRCRVCGTTRALHVHHITYRSHGGGHEPHNLVLVCAAHHRVIHENPKRYRPLLLAMIWVQYVQGTWTRLPALERRLVRQGLLDDPDGVAQP
jgi:5-methylcytosine-specific restriction endonuclease McrA